jgi:hypothetical protein
MSIEDPETNPSQQLVTFTQLAKGNTDEGWATIDEQLAEYCNDPEFLTWARANTANEESGLRDLAATIFERSDAPLDDEDVSKLLILMREMDPDNPYPSFRAACALAKRPDNQGVREVLEEVRTKLKSFVDDEDVSGIAKQYLEKLGA